jgi:hypothetical protein
MPELKFKFDRHGLGDVCHMAHAVQLYKRRGYEVTVQAEENKLFLWKVAGVNIVQGGDLPDHSYHYPSGFDDLSLPDHATNKVAFGLRHDVLPKLEELGLTQEQAWDELCSIRLSAHDFISAAAHAEAERFLEGLPRPIICLHSRGTNWHERKSLPTEVAFDLILKLLDQTGGSVVVLDFDRRAPMVGDARCKGIKPAWGHINIEKLCALYEHCDLMIGVDSGPLHVASLTNIKTLGVFRSLHPPRVCLPNSSAVYLVNSKSHAHWVTRPGWSFAEYTGEEPTADDIVHVALARLTAETPKELFVNNQQLAGWYEYNRVGHDKRRLQLLPDGTIGIGAQGCEQRWFARSDSLGQTIVISGKHGVICNCTRQGSDSVFVGRWTQFERMPIELTQIQAPGTRGVLPERILLVMNWDDAFDEIATITAPNRIAYATSQGYRHGATHFPGAWGKLNAILHWWDHADWLFWLDMDALITTPTKRLEEYIEGHPESDVILTCDRNGLCSGSMLIRTVPHVRDILEDLLARRAQYDLPNGCCEQTGLAYLFWKIADRVTALPKRQLDPYPSEHFPEVPEPDGWHPGDFAIHVPALPTQKRIEILRHTLDRVGTL